MSSTGSVPPVISGVQAGGANPGDFLLEDLCQQPVAPGSSCQLGVRFAPQAKGSRTATLTVVSDAPTTPPVTLAGIGGKGGKQSTANHGPGASVGQVVCRTGADGTAISEIECAPATYKIHGASVNATFSVQQATVSCGTAPGAACLSALVVASSGCCATGREGRVIVERHLSSG